MAASSVNILTKFPKYTRIWVTVGAVCAIGKRSESVCVPGFCASALTVMGLADWFGNYVLICVAALFMVTIIKDLGSHLWARWLWPQSHRCVCVYWQQPITLWLIVVNFCCVWPLWCDFELDFGSVQVGNLKIASLVICKLGSQWMDGKWCVMKGYMCSFRVSDINEHPKNYICSCFLLCLNYGWM